MSTAAVSLVSTDCRNSGRLCLKDRICVKVEGRLLCSAMKCSQLDIGQYDLREAAFANSSLPMHKSSSLAAS